ncbi:hypothetical protein [Polaromonas sp.]|uniref:hypothetical protein n=1 Tax=Polaromonas sp. TaxID=1869339 RepID=UPI0025CE52C2|nr:hypothetical protein [Polaromonas sp.]
MACRCYGVALLLVAGPAAWAEASAPHAASGRVPQPVIEPARGGQCVGDPAFMRRNHMTLLKHQRDDTLRGGIRTEKYSLKACIACHASQTSGSVNLASSNFCQSCHAYAAVKIDCFECHANKPPANSFPSLVSHGMPGGNPLSLQLRQLVVQQQVKP